MLASRAGVYYAVEGYVTSIYTTDPDQSVPIAEGDEWSCAGSHSVI